MYVIDPQYGLGVEEATKLFAQYAEVYSSEYCENVFRNSIGEKAVRGYTPKNNRSDEFLYSTTKRYYNGEINSSDKGIQNGPGAGNDGGENISRNSLKVDTSGNELTPEQQKFFANAKTVGRQGRLMTLYPERPTQNGASFNYQRVRSD